MKIFISYAKDDVEFARRLYNDLKKIPEVAPWLDEVNLLPGSNWEGKIFDAIDQSQFVIVLLSSQAINKTGFIQKEFRKAIDRLGYYPPEKIFIIPARIDECTPQYQELRQLQWVDLFPDWEVGVKRILETIGAKIVTHKFVPVGNTKHGTAEILDLSRSKSVNESKGNSIDIDLEGTPFLDKASIPLRSTRRDGLAERIFISLWSTAQEYPKSFYRKSAWTYLDSLIFDYVEFDRTPENINSLEFVFRTQWALAKEMPNYKEDDWILLKRIIENK